jgi:hypothetical protein
LAQYSLYRLARRHPALKESTTVPPNDGECKVALAHVSDERHIYKVVTGTAGAADSVKEPDVANGCSAVSVDLFPATTVYVTGTVVDREAKYWDPEKKSYVTGPLESRFYYQMAGRHPDLNKNCIDDYVEIATGKVKTRRSAGFLTMWKQEIGQSRLFWPCSASSRLLARHVAENVGNILFRRGKNEEALTLCAQAEAMMKPGPPVIQSDRLDLISITPAALHALLAGNSCEASGAGQ